MSDALDPALLDFAKRMAETLARFSKEAAAASDRQIAGCCSSGAQALFDAVELDGSPETIATWAADVAAAAFILAKRSGALGGPQEGQADG